MLDLFCLSLVVYVEARGEPIDGQMLVAEVVINRTQVERFPDDVCSVVFDEAQFSGITTDMDLVGIFSDPDWKTSQQVAETALEGNLVGTEATHFHADYVKPYWSKHLTKLGQYGKHIFYIEEVSND
jgi:spore germination cell wall hydrolase CwlJ-like protein